MLDAHVILWIYIVLLELGGFMGFIKAKSKASLIASTISAGILILFNLNILPFRWCWVALAFLAVLFAYRFIKTKKIMPNAMMVALTVIVLLLIGFSKTSV